MQSALSAGEREAVAGCQRATETREGGEERRRQRDIQGDGDGAAAAAASGRGIALLSLPLSLPLHLSTVRSTLSLPPSLDGRSLLLLLSPTPLLLLPLPQPERPCYVGPSSHRPSAAAAAGGSTPVILLLLLLLLLSFFFLRILILHLSISSSVRPSSHSSSLVSLSLYRDYRPRLGGNNSLVALFIISCLLSGLPHLPPLSLPW